MPYMRKDQKTNQEETTTCFNKRKFTPFYLHPCARLSAEFIHDDLTKRSIIPVQKLLSTAAQIQMGEYDIDLTRNLEMAEHPWIAWLQESADHFAWLLSYYETLCHKMDKIFHKPVPNWRFTHALIDAIVAFPSQVWIDPPLPSSDDMSEQLQIEIESTYQTYRNYYIIYYVKLGAYRRVTMPYWIKTLYQEDLTPPAKALSDSEYIDTLTKDD